MNLTGNKYSIKQPGLTLVEVVMSLGLMGVVVALTVPALIKDTSVDIWEARAKSATQQITMARADYIAQNPTSTPADAKAIGSFTKYVAVATSGGLVTGQTCSAANPCYRFSDGAVVQAVGNISSNELTFRIDPDAAGSEFPVSVKLNFVSGRLFPFSESGGSTSGCKSWKCQQQQQLEQLEQMEQMEQQQF